MPYLVTSKFVHSPPKREGYLLGSQRLMGPMPLLPAHKASQYSSTVSPKDVTTPRPVITTRRRIGSCQSSVASCQRRSCQCLHWQLATGQRQLLVGMFLDVI